MCAGVLTPGLECVEDAVLDDEAGCLPGGFCDCEREDDDVEE